MKKKEPENKFERKGSIEEALIESIDQIVIVELKKFADKNQI